MLLKLVTPIQLLLTLLLPHLSLLLLLLTHLLLQTLQLLLLLLLKALRRSNQLTEKILKGVLAKVPLFILTLPKGEIC